MTQPATGLLTKGAEIAAQAASAQFKTLAETVAPDSPLRPFFSPALSAWIEAQLKASKPLDIVNALTVAQLDAAGKAQANAKLVADRDGLRTRLDDVGGRLIALEQGRNLGLIRIKEGRTTYLLEERDSEIVSAMSDGAWSGALTFLLYSPIQDNAAFQRVMEVLFKSGFDGRIVGKPLVLKGVSIKRFVAKGESDAQRGAVGLVRVEYTALRVPAAGRVVEIDGGYEIKAGVV